jgi:hypothetical protein
MAKARSAEFKSPKARLSYAKDLFKASKVNEGDARESFRCTLIFDVRDRAELEKHVAEVIIAEWGPKGIERAKAGLIRSPFLAGDGREARNKQSGDINPGLGPDKFFIRPSANADRPPFVIWKDPNKQETEATVYSGCFGKAILQAFAWSNSKSGDGVSFGISGFQKIAEGERLGGGPVDPSKFFETVEDQGDAPAETRNGAGAGGLFGSNDSPF